MILKNTCFIILLVLLYACKKDAPQNTAPLQSTEKEHECFKTGIGCSSLNLEDRRAEEAYSIGCSKGDLDSCTLLGQYYEVVAKKYDLARQYYSEACNKKEKIACESLDLMEVALNEKQEEQERKKRIKEIKITNDSNEYTVLENKKIYHHEKTLCVYKDEKIELILGNQNKVNDEESKEFGQPILLIKQGKKVSYSKVKYQSLKFYNPHMSKNCFDDNERFKDLFFVQNNRPFRDYTISYVYDSKLKKILKRQKFDHLLFENEFGFFVDRTYATDSISNKVKIGEEVVELKPNPFFSLYVLELQKNKIVKIPKPFKTFKHFPVNFVFPNIRAFNKMFGFNGKGYDKKWYFAFRIDKKQCLQATVTRTEKVNIKTVTCER
jgi:hypothetical protein